MNYWILLRIRRCNNNRFEFHNFRLGIRINDSEKGVMDSPKY